MAIVEVAYHVGSIDPTDTLAYQDGQVVAWKPPGVLFTAQSMQAWYAAQVLPPNWGDLNSSEMQRIQRSLNHNVWVTAPGRTAEDLADVRTPTWRTLPQEQQDEILAEESYYIAITEAFVLSHETYGFDTNWSNQVLKDHGTVVIDTPDARLTELWLPPFDQTKHVLLPAPETAKNRYRVTYEQQAQSTVDAIRDPGVLVSIDRQSVFAMDTVLESIIFQVGGVP